MSTKVPPLNLARNSSSSTLGNTLSGNSSAISNLVSVENDKSSTQPPRPMPQSPRSIKNLAQVVPQSPRLLKSVTQPTAQFPHPLKKKTQLHTESPTSTKVSVHAEKDKALTGNQLAIEALPKTTRNTTVVSSASGTLIPEPSREPVFKVTRKRVEVSSSRLEKAERDYVPTMLGNMIIEHICKGELLPDQLHKVGRMPPAYRRDKLPPELKILAEKLSDPYIPAPKLLQGLFAEDFKKTPGWQSATVVCVHIMREIAIRGPVIEVGEVDPQVKESIQTRLQAHANSIVLCLLGHPVSLSKSPLPSNLTDFLISCDQHFHMNLMQGEQTRHFTTEQMRDARMALQKQLLVTYLLQPMLSNFASPFPSQTEIWFFGMLLKGMLKALPPFSNDVLGMSYANSPKKFQDAVTEKYKIERLQKIRNTRKATFRTKQGNHQRSRSADVKLVDPNSLPTREQMQKYRATKRTESLAKEFEKSARQFDNLLESVGKNVEENSNVSKALDDLKNFNADELADVLRILEDRDVNAIEMSGDTTTTTDTSAPDAELTTTNTRTDAALLTTTTTTTIPSTPTTTFVTTSSSVGISSEVAKASDNAKQAI